MYYLKCIQVYTNHWWTDYSTFDVILGTWLEDKCVGFRFQQLYVPSKHEIPDYSLHMYPLHLLVVQPVNTVQCTVVLKIKMYCWYICNQYNKAQKCA